MAPDHESWNREHSDLHFSVLARSFVTAASDEVSGIIRGGIDRARDWSGVDELVLVTCHAEFGHEWIATDEAAPTRRVLEAILARGADGEGLAARVRAGDDIVVHGVDDLDASSGEDRGLLETEGVDSLLLMPVVDGKGRLLGCLAASMVGRRRHWGVELTGRMRMLADIWISIKHRQNTDLHRQLSELRFETLVRFASDLVCEFDHEGRLVFVSGGAEQVLGVPTDDLLGYGYVEAIHPDDRAEVGRMLRVNPARPYDRLEVRLRTRDGNELRMEAEGSAFPELPGPPRVLVLLRDVSHRYEQQVRLETHLSVEREVTRLAREFVGLESASLTDAFRGALETSTEIAGCDQGYVVITMPDLNAGEPEVHVWSRPGLSGNAIAEAAAVGPAYHHFYELLKKGEPIVLPRVDSLPPEAATERAAFEAHGLGSYLGLPLMEGGRSVGVLGFATTGRQTAWSEHQISMLQLVAELFGAVFRRARSEAHVREREERFRVLADQSPDPIIEFTGSGRILFASHDFPRLLGDADDDWVGRSLDDFVAPVELGRVAEVRQAALGGARLPAAVFQCRRKDGRHVYLEASMRSFRTARGDVHGIATLRDVTARLESERTLEQQIQLERHIVHISRDFMTRDFDRFDDDVRRNAAVIADLARADHCAIASLATADGRSPEVFEWISERLPDARRSPIDLDSESYPLILDTLRRGERFHMRRRSDLPASAREERAAFEARAVKSFLAIPFMEEQQLAGVFALASLVEEVEWSSKDMAILHLASDVIHGALARRHAARELEQSQLQLLQSQKMEAVGTLAGGIAHDFNNQLAVMLGNARFVLESMSEGDEQREALLDLERAAEHCAQLTRSLLAFSRQTAHESRTVAVAAWLEDVVELVKPLLPTSISLDVDVESGAGAVRGDQTQLQQVMINLLVNARDSMPGGGRIRVHAGRQQLSDDRRARFGMDQADTVELRIEDTGVGMDEAVRARIFEPFFTTKALGEGTGLGLATVYGIVQEAGGHIEVDSLPGEGSTFRVHLPRVEAPTSERVRGGEAAGESTGSFDTVLLVEDEPAVRRVVRRMLEPRAKNVVEAQNGDEALEIVGGRLHEIDLLVTDLVMPRMGGLDLARRIAAERPDLPTLFLSGYPDDQVDFDDEPARVHRFLQKPFTQRDLWQALESLLDAAG